MRKRKKKTHIKVEGQLRMVNKDWKHLKMAQKDWIMQQTITLHHEKRSELDRPLKKEERMELIDQVYSRIEERDIWIPYSVIKDKCSKKIGERERKMGTGTMRI